MTYDFKGLEELIEKFERGENLTQTEENTLVAIHSVGRDGIFANGHILYHLTSTEYEKICMEVDSDLSVSAEDKCNIREERLHVYANSLNYIISEMLKNSPAPEYRRELFESLNFSEHLSAGLERLKRL